jgi:hypothetical protein
MGDHLGESRLPGSWRPIEDERTESIRQEHSTQQFAFAEEVLLADELVDGPWPHARGQRSCLAAVLIPDVGEDVDD